MARSKTFAFTRGRTSRSKPADEPPAVAAVFPDDPAAVFPLFPLRPNDPPATLSDWHARCDERASKAHRLLGTSSAASDSRRGSDHSASTHRLRPQASTPTLHSYYDAKKTPLSISQQTSDSAVRDRALRRGKPTILADQDDAPPRDAHKSKSLRLDLSKLFPKPRGGHSHGFVQPMLSPEKLVNSPAAMSTASDYFAQPMTRDPTLDWTESLSPKPTTHREERHEYEKAKVHVRRPPKGVQHWFDAFDDDSDEAAQDAEVPFHAPPKARPKSPLDRTPRHAAMIQSAPRPKQSPRQSDRPRDSFAHDDIVDIDRQPSPSLYSVNTHLSLASSRTKTSALSKANLHDASVLSFSSSEDEDGTSPRAPRFSVRKSLDLVADAGDIVIGQARALKVRPHVRQQSSEGVSSSRSTTSTNAATIEVMYAPEVPLVSYQYQGHFPRNSIQGSSRRSSHVRQPSVIHEDEDGSPSPAVKTPASPSTRSLRSTRASANEPVARWSGSRKFMAVTAEEEALLELMRKKRAELHKKAPSSTATDSVAKHGHREPHGASPSKALEEDRSRFSEQIALSTDPVFSPTPLLVPSRRGSARVRSKASTRNVHDSAVNAPGDTWSDRHNLPRISTKLPHFLPPPAEFSPLEPFPLPSPDPVSQPPSPLTPGLCIGEVDVAVKVASSDTSADADEGIMFESSGIDTLLSNRVKPDSSHSVPDANHQRRRTASSGADMPFSTSPTTVISALTPVSETLAGTTSVTRGDSFAQASKEREKRLEEPIPRGPLARNWSRQSSVHSTVSRVSLPLQGSDALLALVDKGSNRLVSRTSSVASKASSRDRSRTQNLSQDAGCGTRYLASDDVLAAWSSLGGTF